MSPDEARTVLYRHLADASEGAVAQDQITPQTKLRDDLDLNSIESLDLLMDLEEALAISVEEDELDGMETVGDLEQIVLGKLGTA